MNELLGSTVLAFALLMSDDLPANIADYNTPYIRHNIREIAVAMEILDRKEYRWICTDKYPAQFSSDLHELQKRRKEFENVPRLSDCYRFAPRESVVSWVNFNTSYQSYLNNLQASNCCDKWLCKTAIDESSKLARFWGNIRDASTTSFYVPVRRRALGTARDIIGIDEYYSGNIHYAPIWRFELHRYVSDVCDKEEDKEPTDDDDGGNHG